MFSTPNRVFGHAIVVTLACAAVLLPASVRAEDTGTYACAVLGTKITPTKDTRISDYNGVRYYFCCGSCKPEFDLDPVKVIHDPQNKDRMIGASLFDPVTTKRIEPEKAAAHSDYNSVRYFFAQADDKQTFDKVPKQYATAPDKHLLFCPVSNQIVAGYAKAADYSNYKGTRYYFCCPGCKPQFDKDPDKYLQDLDARVKAAKHKAVEAQEKSQSQ